LLAANLFKASVRCEHPLEAFIRLETIQPDTLKSTLAGKPIADLFSDRLVEWSGLAGESCALRIVMLEGVPGMSKLDELRSTR
jgi:hypothetical protein